MKSNQLYAIDLENAGRLPQVAWAVVAKVRPVGGGRLKTAVFTHMRKAQARDHAARLIKLKVAEQVTLLCTELAWEPAPDEPSPEETP